MNKKLLLFTATLGIAYIGLTSYSGGPATSASLNRTGAAGSSANCAGGGCHAASSTGTSTFIEMADPATPSVKVTKYTPGKTYLMTIRGTSTPARAKFGFQVAATKSDNTNGGTIAATASGTGTHTISGIKIIEHTTALAASPSAGSYTVNFNWTAPAKGAGTITFYGILNAVDGTGSSSNDLPGNGVTAAFTEDVASGIATVSGNENISIYPNPCTATINIAGLENAGKEFKLSVWNLSGREVLGATALTSLDVSHLPQGIYILQLNDGTTSKHISFVKQ